MNFVRVGSAALTIFLDIARILHDRDARFGAWKVDHADSVDLSTNQFDDFSAGIDWVQSHCGDFAAEADVLFSPLLSRNGPGVLTFRDYSNNPVNQRVVSLYQDGSAFTTGGDEREAFVIGLKAAESFKLLCSSLHPTYASLTVDCPMETPDQLKRGEESLAFRDFYVSEEFFGAKITTKIEQTFDQKYMERLESGLFISSTPFFNQRRIENKDAFATSRVARIIGGCLQLR